MPTKTTEPQAATESITAIRMQVQTLKDKLSNGENICKWYASHLRRSVRAEITAINLKIVGSAQSMGYAYGDAPAASPITLRLLVDSPEVKDLARLLAINSALSTPELDEADEEIARIEAEIVAAQAREQELLADIAQRRHAVAERLIEAQARVEADPEVQKLRADLAELEKPI